MEHDLFTKQGIITQNEIFLILSEAWFPRILNCSISAVTLFARRNYEFSIRHQVDELHKPRIW